MNSKNSLLPNYVTPHSSKHMDFTVLPKILLLSAQCTFYNVKQKFLDITCLKWLLWVNCACSLLSGSLTVFFAVPHGLALLWWW